MRDEMLEPLIRGRIALGQARLHRLHRFPLAVIQEALDVAARTLALGLTSETPGEAIQKLAKSCEEGPDGGDRLGHRRAVSSPERRPVGACSGEPLVRKAMADLAMEIRAPGRRGEQGADDASGDGEITIDGPTAERHVERGV